MKNGFTLTPAYGDNFVGRKGILSKIAKEIKNPGNNMGFCLHGRRRVGKTSILKELELELSGSRNIVVAYISLYELADLSLRTFTEQLSLAVLESFRRKKVLPLEYAIPVLLKSPKEVVESALSKIKVGAEISKEISFFLEFKRGEHSNYTEAAKRAFGLGEKLAQASGKAFVLILDEFPEILKVENGAQLVKVLRTVHEGHKKTTLIISGSERQTLEMVALGGASPFYKQLIPIQIPPFSFEETKEFIRKYGLRLSESGTRKLFEYTAGVPFYLQYIGRSAKIGMGIEQAIGEFVKEEGNLFFREEFGKLSPNERKIVLAAARGAISPTNISQSSGEAVTSVSSYLVSLQGKGVVKKTGKGEYALVDVLFEVWLRAKYGA